MHSACRDLQSEPHDRRSRTVSTTLRLVSGISGHRTLHIAGTGGVLGSVGFTFSFQKPQLVSSPVVARTRRQRLELTV